MLAAEAPVPYTVIEVRRLEALREDNSNLRKEIATLQTDKTKLLLEMDIKTATIDSLKLDNERLRTELAEIRKALSSLTGRNIARKFMTSIQDLNALYGLETQLDSDIAAELYTLRQAMVGAAHYLYTEGAAVDSEEVIKYKTRELLDRLLAHRLDESIREYISLELLDEMIVFMKKLDLVCAVPPRDRKAVTLWWRM